MRLWWGVSLDAVNKEEILLKIDSIMMKMDRRRWDEEKLIDMRWANAWSDSNEIKNFSRLKEKWNVYGKEIRNCFCNGN